MLTLKRPRISRLAAILAFAAYIALLLNIAFYRQVLALLPFNSLYNVLVFVSMPVALFCIISVILLLASFVWLERPLISLFILLSAAAQYFILTYGIIVDRSMVTNIVDTTPAESFALMSPHMMIVLLLSGVAMAVLVWCVAYRPAASCLRSVLPRLMALVVSALVIVLIAFFFYKDYASLFL